MNLDLSVGLLVFASAIFVVLFFVFRWITLWYFRINEHIENQDRIIKLLERIANEQ